MSKNTLEIYQKDTKDHVLTIEQDAGVHRCILFKNPESSFYAFRIVTWPGHLAVSGDMGDFVFSRVSDMFTFFRGDTINPGYWAAKCVAGDPYEFDTEAWGRVLEDLEGNVEDEVLEELRQEEPYNKDHAMLTLYSQGIVDAEQYECSFDTYSVHFLWCLMGIIDVIARYDDVTSKNVTDSVVEM